MRGLRVLVCIISLIYPSGEKISIIVCLLQQILRGDRERVLSASLFNCISNPIAFSTLKVLSVQKPLLTVQRRNYTSFPFLAIPGV